MSAWFVGGYSSDMGGETAGIGLLQSGPDGALEYSGLVAPVSSPSYLLHAGDTVYSVSEEAGRVESYRSDGETLTHLGGVDIGGRWPCHLGIFGTTILASCYDDGRIGVLDTHGLALTQVYQGEGSGPLPEQGGPHAHSTFSVDGQTILGADLGADRINVFSLENGVLSLITSTLLPAGTGPRDFILHASDFVYLLGELSCEILVLRVEGPVVSVLDSIPIPGAQPGDHAAALSMTDDGRFLFVGLRGSNLISTLGVSPDGRTLASLAVTDCRGDWPRHHVVDGDLLHVANERSNSVSSFSIGRDGSLSAVGDPATVPSPTFLLRTGFAMANPLLK